jgi:2Fe-2S ferredoxin
VPKIVFIGPDRVERAVDAAAGESVMVAATKNGVPGIIGECGGNASCGTCHVWVREAYQQQVGPPGEDLEEDLLDLGVSDRRENSRLSCQIKVTDELDGLTLDVPPEQP